MVISKASSIRTEAQYFPVRDNMASVFRSEIIWPVFSGQVSHQITNFVHPCTCTCYLLTTTFFRHNFYIASKFFHQISPLAFLRRKKKWAKWAPMLQHSVGVRKKPPIVLVEKGVEFGQGLILTKTLLGLHIRVHTCQKQAGQSQILYNGKSEILELLIFHTISK